MQCSVVANSLTQTFLHSGWYKLPWQKYSACWGSAWIKQTQLELNLPGFKEALQQQQWAADYGPAGTASSNRNCQYQQEPSVPAALHEY